MINKYLATLYPYPSKCENDKKSMYLRTKSGIRSLSVIKYPIKSIIPKMSSQAAAAAAARDAQADLAQTVPEQGKKRSQIAKNEPRQVCCFVRGSSFVSATEVRAQSQRRTLWIRLAHLLANCVAAPVPRVRVPSFLPPSRGLRREERRPSALLA